MYIKGYCSHLLCSLRIVTLNVVYFDMEGLDMNARKLRVALIALLITISFIATGLGVYAAPVSISSYTAPTNLKVGQSFAIKGTIKSTSTIKRVEVGIVSSKGKWTNYKYDNKKVNSKSFNVKKADKTLKFGKLKAGTYYYRVYAHTKDGKVHTLLNKKFTVKAATTSSAKVSVSALTYPIKHNKGYGFAIRGKLTSSQTIKTVTVGVTKENGSWTNIKASTTVNAKTFDISKLDSKIKFGQLGVGTYIYKVVVATSSGSITAVNKKFTVKNAPASIASTIKTKATATSVNTLKDRAGGATNCGSEISFSGLKKPSNYKIGSKFKPAGTINSKKNIKKIEVGIVYAPTNKWTAHKYDKNNVNSTKFNISDAASRLRFDLLPAGVYRYRIYVHTDTGVHLALNHQFKVSGNGKPEAALQWAIAIANDNSFTYGTRPSTARVGCYFCGTNQHNKPKGYEKTYVCMTFAHAAYAHGAKDPEMLKHCKGGKYCLSLNDTVFKDYTCWEKIGYCKDLKVEDLLPGDIICWYADDDYSGHLSLYAGNGDIVDAGKEGWSADSIAIRKGRAAYYLSRGASFNKKSFVMRYRK